MSRLAQLLARRDKIVEELRTLSELDTDAFTDEQEKRYDELNDELERSEGEGDAARTVGLLADIEREQRRADTLSRATAPRDNGMGTEGGSQPDAWRDRNGTPNVNVRDMKGPELYDMRGVAPYGEARSTDARARALVAIERSDRIVSDSHKQQLTRHIERNGYEDFYAEFVLTGLDPAYADGFLRSLTGQRGGFGAQLTPEQRHALEQRHMLARAMGLADVTGVLVPAHLDTALILANDGRTNPLRNLARVETGTTNVYRSVRTSGVTHDWTAEGAEVGDNAPDFENPTATAYKGTVFVPISFEAYEDARGREGDILMAMDDSVDDAEALVFTTGNGTTVPRGLITALAANTNSIVNTVTSNVFGSVDVYNIYEDLPPRYRNVRTAWLSNIGIRHDIRRFGDDQLSNQTVPLSAGELGPILGKPSYEASYMDGTIAVNTTDNVLAVGDPQTYLIYDRLGTSVEFVPNLFGTTNGRPTGQRGWLMHHRTGANLTVGHAAADTVVGWRLLQVVTNA
jgi:HK97 family phage major capsid protein